MATTSRFVSSALIGVVYTTKIMMSGYAIGAGIGICKAYGDIGLPETRDTYMRYLDYSSRYSVIGGSCVVIVPYIGFKYLKKLYEKSTVSNN